MPADSMLFASPFFFPEEISTGKYNSEFVREMVKAGCKVTVIASHPLYPAWRPVVARGGYAGARVLRGGRFVRYPRSAYLRRAVLELWFALHVALQAVRQPAGELDVAVVPPSLFALLLPFLHRARRRVLLVHDLQAHFAAARGCLGRMAAAVVAAVERTAFRRYDRVVFLSAKMRAAAIAEYGLRPQRCVVRYPFRTVMQFGSEGAELADVLPPGRRQVVYAGALGDKQNPRQLLKFFEAAGELCPEAQFHIFSGGPDFDGLRARFGASPVRFHPLVSEAQLGELYRRADVQVIPQASGTGDAALPSKLPNVLASGAAVIGICDADSELAAILRRSGGEAVGWDERSFVATLRAQLACTRSEDRRHRCELAKMAVLPEFDAAATVAAVLDAA